MPKYKIGSRILDIQEDKLDEFLTTAQSMGDNPVLIEENDEAGKTPPQVTGAPVVETAAPENTVSMPEDTLSASQKVEPLSFIQKGIVLTENQLKTVTGFEDDVDFGDSYVLSGPNDYKQNLTKSQIQEAATKYGMTAKEYLQRFVNNPNYGVQVIPGGETNIQTLNEVIVTAEMPDYMRPIYNETRYDLIDLEVQTKQKESEFLEQGYNAKEAAKKAEEFKFERTKEIIQLKNRKLDSPTDRQILSNLLKKPEEFSLEEVDKGIKLMSDAIIKEQNQKLDSYKSFSKEVTSKQVELRNLKTAIDAEKDETSKSILISQYNDTLSSIKEKSDYWNGWIQNYENKVNEFNKALQIRDKAVATDVFNKTISDQALKDYSISSRIDYNVTEFVTDVFSPFYSDKVVLQNQKLLDIQKDKLVKAMSVDDASAEGLVLRSWAESAADNSASTIGSVLLYTTPAGAIAAPVVFGLSSAGQRRSQLLQQQTQGAASKVYLFDELKSAKGQAADNIKKEIQAIDKIMELTSSGVYLTSLASGIIEGGITYLSGQLGLKGINAIPGLRGVLSKSSFTRNLLGKMQIPGKLSGLGQAARVVPAELAEETAIAGLDNELVDGLILGNRRELSEVYTKEFFRDVIVSTIGVSSTTGAAKTIPKVPLLLNNRKAKLENKKLVDFIINEKEKLKNFDTREELSEQDQEARNTILQNISETADKLNINQQNQLVSIENLTNEEIKTLYRTQAEKASIRTKVSELNAEAIKQGKKLEDLIDRESLNELQRRYDILENKVSEITDPLSTEQRKDISLQKQYDLERKAYNIALSRTKKDAIVLGENLAEELVLSQLQELSRNEQNLDTEQIESRRAELKDALKNIISKNSSFNELSTEKQKVVLDYIENNAGFETELATSNGQYIKGTGIKFINDPLINATILSDNVSRIEQVSAIEAPVHETLHEYTDYNKIQNATIINAGVELKRRLESKYKDLSKEDVTEIKKRINSYEKSNTKAQAYEELMNLYNDLNRVGIINDSEIDNSYNLFGLIKEVRSNVFAGLSKAGLSGEQSVDAISHLRGFNRYLESKKQIKVNLDQDVDTDVTSTLSSKSLSDIKESFDNIVSNQDGSKKFNTKEEFKSSDAVNQVRTLIENTNILDGSIKNLATRYGAKSVDVKAVKEIISDRVANNFNPELNESLFGYILGKNGILNFAYRDYVNNQNKQIDAESIDVEEGEVGFIGQVADEYVDEYEDFESMDISIGARKKQVEEAQLIEPAYIFGEETGFAVDQKAIEFVENNDLEDVNMKSTPMFGVEEVSKMLGLRPNVIFDKKLNLNSGEVTSIADFLYNNIEDVIRILPDAFVEEGVSQKYVGTSTGIPNNLLKLFYISTNDADSSNRIGVNGLYPWILKGELQKLGKAGSKISEETKNEILDQFGILPNGKLKESGLGRKPEGQSMKGIMGLVLKLGSNTAIRKAAITKGEYDQITIEDIGAGKSLAMASSNLSSAEIKADFTQFKKAITASTTNILDSLSLSTEGKGFNFTEDEINKAIEEGFMSDNALGQQSFIAERILKTRESIKSLALGIDPSFIKSKSLILGYFGLDHRTILLDFNSIQELSGRGEDGDLYKKSLFENNKKVKDANRAKEIIARKEDVYDAIISNAKLSWKISPETKKLFGKVKKTGLPYTSQTAKKYVGLNKEQAEQKAFEQDFESNEERVNLLKALDSLVLDYYKYKVENGSKQDILDAVSLVTFMTQSTSNISRGRRALAVLDINASIFDEKAAAYQIEHLDTNVKTSMEFFNGILLNQDVSNITAPEIAVLPVYGKKVKNKAGINILVNKNSLRVELDKIKGYKFGTKELKKQIINNRKQDIYFPNVLASKGADVDISPLESKFAGMISAKDARITPGQRLDLATAKNLAAQRKKRFDIIAPGANDFDGLMYTILADGKLGEEQYEWIKENLYKPYSIATYRLNNTRQDAAIRFKNLKKENRELFKKLQQDSGFGGFTFEQALRVWLFQKAGYTPSGLDEDTQKALVKIVKKNKDIEKLGKELSNILPIEEYWVEPDANNWQVESLKKDVVDAIEKVARKQFLSEWKNNVDQIFSKNNMNKLLAAFGEDYTEALKDMLYRMETGSSRPEGSNARMNRFMNWVRGSVATTMFFNRRSAVLQQISNVNFLNWGDNNPIAAAKAFADFDQYSKDFLFILNSNYLKERRGGLKTDVNAADLADAIKRGGYSGFLARLLQAGFSLTQYGDSFAIATGGATFYRNRINTYLKQGKNQQEAEQQAFLDFQEISEETQQSARPDRLSQEQTTVLGRVFLAFQNTPMQMTRLAVKAGKDLLAKRGDPKQNIFKMGYYGVVQSIIFSMLQTALIGDMFDFDDEEEDEKAKKLKQTKTRRVVNGVVDSFLKGTGIYGVFVTTAKNAALKFYEQQKRIEEGKRPDYTYVMLEGLNVSPPIGIKARNFYAALKNYEYNSKYIKDVGYNLNNPALDIGSSVTEALLNIPAHNVLTTVRDLSAMVDEDVDTFNRIALGLGWHTWDLGLEDKQLDELKTHIRETNKQLRQSKKIKRAKR